MFEIIKVTEFPITVFTELFYQNVFYYLDSSIDEAAIRIFDSYTFLKDDGVRYHDYEVINSSTSMVTYNDGTYDVTTPVVTSVINIYGIKTTQENPEVPV